MFCISEFDDWNLLLETSSLELAGELAGANVLDEPNTGFVTWRVYNVACQHYGKDDALLEKVLKLEQIQNCEEKIVCHLRHDWSRMQVDVEDILLISSQLFSFHLVFFRNFII